MIRLIVADDHVIVRQGFQQLLSQQPDFEVVGETGEGDTTLRLIEELHPDVLVLDLVMPGRSGLDVLEQLQQAASSTKVVVLSVHDDRNYVLHALRSGALAYILKESSVQELIQAIRFAVRGQHYLSPGLVEHVVTAYLHVAGNDAPNPAEVLSPRERDVLRLIGEGQTTSEIAQALALKPRTVETYRQRLRTKLGLRSLADLRHYVQQHPL